MIVKPATRRLASWAALVLAVALPASASQHTSAECREGGDFIRNATLSRDSGLSRDAFLDRLIADLSMIRGLPETVRWFARDEVDETLLIRHTERVYDYRMSAKDNEQAFLAECGRDITQTR